MSQDPARIHALNARRRAAGETMILSLLNNIDGNALQARAEALRGIACNVILPTSSMAYRNSSIVGGCNYHGSIVFEDGVIWLARFRLPNHNSPPVEERNFDRRSEYATYSFLKKALVPVPEVFEVADDNDPNNPVGSGYILLEKFPGNPMDWDAANDLQKDKVCQQLADIYTKIKKQPLDRLGRLQPSSSNPTSIEVGPAFFTYDQNGNATAIGPFKTSNEYYTAIINHRLNLVKTREIAPSAPTDQYLVFKTLLDNLPNNDDGPFYLRHTDSRDANFLVDEDFNITGVIDWELATVVPKASAFQSPLFMYDLTELYDEGLSTPSVEEARFGKVLREKGEDELAGFAVQKMFFRLDQCVDTDPLVRDQFEELFAGWWMGVKGVGGFDWEDWRKDSLGKYGDGIELN